MQDDIQGGVNQMAQLGEGDAGREGQAQEDVGQHQIGVQAEGGIRGQAPVLQDASQPISGERVPSPIGRGGSQAHGFGEESGQGQ